MKKVSIYLFVMALMLGWFSLSASAQSSSAADQLTVAAAADLKFALEEISAAYTKQSGISVRATYGSSGSLFAQIANGAPYDVFLSADAIYPQKLVEAAQAVPDSMTYYARGALVVWIAPGKEVPTDRSLSFLVSPQIGRIAIANPKHAPYGRAAEAALRHDGLWEKLQPKLIFGENIAQTAQFVESGNADAGLVALSLVKSGKSAGGTWWEIPLDTYPALDQAAVITSRGAGKRGGREFIQFLSSPAAKAIFERYGFRPPSRREGATR